MNKYYNVECRRCGRQWYSPKLDEENQVPENCPYCYQEDVQEIPEPPTKIDVLKEELTEKWNATPEKIREKKHEAKIFVENNKMLISMANVGLIITLSIGILVYVLFIQ